MSLSLPTYFRSVPDKVWFMYLMQMKGESERLNCQVTPPSAKGFKKWANASASLMRSLMPHSSTTATIRRRCRGDRGAKTSAKASRSSTAEKRAEGTSCWRSTSSTQCKDHASWQPQTLGQSTSIWPTEFDNLNQGTWQPLQCTDLCRWRPHCGDNDFLAAHGLTILEIESTRKCNSVT